MQKVKRYVPTNPALADGLGNLGIGFGAFVVSRSCA